jgi:hypothetical protein
MSTPHLARIGYVSAVPEYPSRAELDSLLSGWRRKNAQRGITGLLLHDAGSVFQVIEGFPEDVVRLYEAIACDPRHRFVAKLVHLPVCERAFGDWSMGLGRATAADLAAAPALRSFADPAFGYAHCDELMAEALLDAFTTGPFRRSIV